MTRFVDGPAKGQLLLLKRAPLFLRVVLAPDGKWDALDQLEDKPAPEEKLFAYEITAPPGWCFMDGPKCRGRYASAEYRLVAQQPMDAWMRDETTWPSWVEAEAKRRGLK